jgi:hypothetical protein
MQRLRETKLPKAPFAAASSGPLHPPAAAVGGAPLLCCCDIVYVPAVVVAAGGALNSLMLGPVVKAVPADTRPYCLMSAILASLWTCKISNIPCRSEQQLGYRLPQRRIALAAVLKQCEQTRIAFLCK